MKKKTMTLITYLIAIYLIFIYNFTFVIENQNYKRKVKYNGLLWCLLDYWSIKKYKSLDKPIKWIDYTKTNKK